MRSTVATVA